MQDVDFVIRLKADLLVFKEFVASNKKSQLVEIQSPRYVHKKKGEQKDEPIKVRLVRVELPTGEVEVLATSLYHVKTYPSKVFKALYFKRWKVETFYDELKNKLKVELFTGYSDKVIQQDFYIALFVSNIQSIIVRDVKEEIEQANLTKKWDYKVNTNLSYGFLKNEIVSLFFSKSDIDDIVEELKTLYKNNLVPIRPNRFNQRNKLRRTIKKLQVAKNQRDAI